MPRAGLTVERIVAAATEIIDRAGSVDALTLARLAGYFGVKTPSLYNHVDGLEDVVYRVGLRTLSDLAEICRRAAMGRAGADALVEIADGYREFVRSRPGTYSLTQVARSDDPGWDAATRDVLEPLLLTLAAMGLDGDDAIHAIRAFRSALHGFASLEVGGGFGLDVDIDESFHRLVDDVVAGLARTDSLCR